MKTRLSTLGKIPPLTQQELSIFFEEFEARADITLVSDIVILLQQHPQQLQHVYRVLSASRFAQEKLLAHPEWLLELLAKEAAYHDITQEQLTEHCKNALCSANSDAQFDHQLRLFRNFWQLRAIWRDSCNLCDMQTTCLEISFLAEVCLHAAHDFHWHALQSVTGLPKNAQGLTQELLIIGMGKFGARELNLSSDIDLIFAYPEKGETDGKKTLSNQEFFEQLGKRIISSLDRITADGFVFRIDMRLRPLGQSGPLVSNFEALEAYYQTQGREWERYAMVKARILGNGNDYAHELKDILNAFTYRRYVDYSMIDALRKLKEMITREEQRRHLHDNIKLGSGGIREIEFIAQVFQLIHGGREHELQNPHLLEVLPKIESRGYLPEGTAAKLSEAYVFLRNTEHALQAVSDEQTQTLPGSAEAQARLAWVMGFSNWENFVNKLNTQRQHVKHQFQQVISSPQAESDTDGEQLEIWRELWFALDPGEHEKKVLLEFGHQNPEKSLALLKELQQSHAVEQLPPLARERLDTFMPRLLAAIAHAGDAGQTLSRILSLIKAILRRSAYLVLLIENPPALAQLVRLAEASPWIANELALHPALLDELLDQRTLYKPPTRMELEDSLRRDMLRIAEDDLEAQLEALRYFRSAHALRVAACEIVGTLPLMKVSDYLTHLAEVVLNCVLNLSWQSLTQQHGAPQGTDNRRTDENTSNDNNTQFLIVGYGKLGGIELGHNSDLDMVFLHDADTNAYTKAEAGQRSIDNQTFYLRLGQKIIHMLDARMNSGRLYEIDMRLRPSGNSGMLVSSLKAFEHYQQKEAWTWEHQALLRARPVAGSNQLAERFKHLRKTILCQKRDTDTLRKEVLEMREKMRKHLGSDLKADGSQPFNIKQDPGGIVDIEFMVQYAALAWAYNDTSIVEHTDNVRILTAMAEVGIFSDHQVKQIAEAYKSFRSLGHKLALQQQDQLVEPRRLLDERNTIMWLWDAYLKN